MRRVRNLLRVALALLVRPGLWLPAIRAAVRMVPDRWWRRPIPSSSYLAYRGRAVYGVPLSEIPPVDVIRYLEWCRAFPGPIR